MVGVVVSTEITFPSASYQEHLRRTSPEALQVIDETVHVVELLQATSLRPLFLDHAHVWGENQYVHLVLSAAEYAEARRKGVAKRLWRLARNAWWRWRNRAFLTSAEA